jgi:hypothetical protein
MFLFPTDTPDQNASMFFQIMLPSDGRFVNLPYGSLFTYMLEKHNCLSIGLYRRGLDGKGFQYLLLNPSPETHVQNHDCLYLLGSRPPTWEDLAPTPG